MTEFLTLNALLAKVSFVVSLHIDVNVDSGKYDLRLAVARNPDEHELQKIVFHDIAQLHCTLDLGGWSQVHMLGMREELLGHERPFKVKEIEYNSISFVCRSVTVL